MNEEQHYLQLSEKPLRFEVANNQTSVFFDDCNCHVFAVRSGGAMGIVVKHPSNKESSINFRIEDRGLVLSIKFTPDLKILCIQRSSTTIELMNFNPKANIIDDGYLQSCKKNSSILGFVWVSCNELALITTLGVELYFILPEKKSLKILRTLNISVEWFLWCNASKIALLAANHGSQLQPISFKTGNVTKLPKVETEAGRMVLERDLVLCSLYDIPSLLILRHQGGCHTSEIHIHTFSGPGQAPVKSYILRLGLFGKFAFNIVDNLIIVHHQASRTSQLFDIGLPGDTDGTIQYHSSIAPAKRIKDASFVISNIGEKQTQQCELYSPNWFVFQPNIIIDEKLGCLWHITVSLPSLLTLIQNINMSTQICLNRSNGRSLLLELLAREIDQHNVCLSAIQDSFNAINMVYKYWTDSQNQPNTSSPINALIGMRAPLLQYTGKVVITQDHVYDILLNLNKHTDSENDIKKVEKRLEHILVTYITSLYEQGLYPQHNITELLISNMVKGGRYSGLIQFIQYGVISDSLETAYLLLLISTSHSDLIQVAIDMFFRLGAISDLQNVLLDNDDIFCALLLNKDAFNDEKIQSIMDNAHNKYIKHSIHHAFKTSK